MLVSETVMDIPLPIKVSDSTTDTTDLPYTILFDDSTTASIPLSQMANLIPPPPVQLTAADGSDSLLPPFLCLNSCITFEHKGQYHKGYLGQLDGICRFPYKSHVNKRWEDWGVPLPNLASNWFDLCVKGILLPGHVSHLFLRLQSSFTPTTFDLVVFFVSAVNVHRDCPPSLLKALADSHLDREIWLDSFFEEKCGIQALNLYLKRLRNSLRRTSHFSNVVHALSYVTVLLLSLSHLSSPVKFYGICTYFDSLLKGEICTLPPQ